MHFEKFVLTILFKKSKIEYQKKKKQPKFSKIVGWLEKDKQTSFFLGLRFDN